MVTKFPDKARYYQEIEKKWNETETQKKYKIELGKGFQVADIYLNRIYLNNFNKIEIIPIREKDKQLDKLRFIEITKIVYDKKEKAIDRLISVYSSLYNSLSTTAIMIKGEKNKIHFFVGIRSEDNPALALDLLTSTLQGNFPGIKLDSLDMKEINTLLNNISIKQPKSLASISVVPSLKNENKNIDEFVQGIEKFIDTMNGKTYTLLCIADPLSPELLQIKKHGYEELYSSLSPHSKISVSYGENQSESVTKGISSSFSTTINRSISNSTGKSYSSSSGRNNSYSSNSNYGFGSATNGSSFNFGGGSGYSNGSFDSYTSGSSFTQSISDSNGSTNTDTSSSGTTQTDGTSTTISLNYENKGIDILLKRAEQQLDRFKKSESFGLWDFSAYVFSDDIHTTAVAANAYKALMCGENSNVEGAHINIWNISQKEKISSILDYILFLKHPKAEFSIFDKQYDNQIITPTNLISGNELPIVMGFPKKSVAGLSVVKMAEFGRSVVYENISPQQTVDFGNIFHMGITEDTRVCLDMNLLSSHCFITGSSGSGKSYATYQLLDKALKNGIKVLIIEPTKGEYKKIFGGVKGIKIFTTDPNSYRLLKINPFQFSEKIHILSHIEQLMQIFMAAWPLYAAMPAILKQAIVKAYIRCGWDVQNSIWIEGVNQKKYPTFYDILDILPNIIDTSDYSSDSKGDYKGALLTRVESMTVGINGLLFKNSFGVDEKSLFDSNTIIDLSELGSNEAIALMMGILIMKLNEYRKNERKNDNSLSLNSNLRHLTVLEEAHNILKRVSTEQSQDSSNMIGQSVEMISNSIKEMRTYGEGFVIIDQSPMAIDKSVIENTSTKIIMNTPAKDACAELASALSLNDQQQNELSRLGIGVAAVYQKGWLTPVLMKVDKWNNKYNSEVLYVNNLDLKILKGNIISEILNQKYNSNKFSALKLRTVIRNSDIPIDKKKDFEEIILRYYKMLEKDEISESNLGNLYLEIIGCESLFEIIPQNGLWSYFELEHMMENLSDEDFNEVLNDFDNNCIRWLELFVSSLSSYISGIDKKTLNKIIIEMLKEITNNGENNSNKLSMVYHSLKYKVYQNEDTL